MNQFKKNIIDFFKSIIGISARDIKIQFRNISYILSILIFFIIIILLFIFSIGPNEEQLEISGVAIIWTVLVLSSSITVNKLLKDDYDDSNFEIYQFSGLSFELIALSKIITSWILFQLPLLILIPLISIVLSIDQNKIYMLIITMAIGSPILSILSVVASSMLLTNNKNFNLGGLIIFPMSIPIIIFAVGAVNTDVDLFIPQINILISMLLASLALGPWVISACIKIALRS